MGNHATENNTPGSVANGFGYWTKLILSSRCWWGCVIGESAEDNGWEYHWMAEELQACPQLCLIKSHLLCFRSQIPYFVHSVVKYWKSFNLNYKKLAWMFLKTQNLYFYMRYFFIICSCISWQVWHFIFKQNNTMD